MEKLTSRPSALLGALFTPLGDALRRVSRLWAARRFAQQFHKRLLRAYPGRFAISQGWRRKWHVSEARHEDRNRQELMEWLRATPEQTLTDALTSAWTWSFWLPTHQWGPELYEVFENRCARFDTTPLMLAIQAGDDTLLGFVIARLDPRCAVERIPRARYAHRVRAIFEENEHAEPMRHVSAITLALTWRNERALDWLMGIEGRVSPEERRWVGSWARWVSEEDESFAGKGMALAQKWELAGATPKAAQKNTSLPLAPASQRGRL